MVRSEFLIKSIKTLVHPASCKQWWWYFLSEQYQPSIVHLLDPTWVLRYHTSLCLPNPFFYDHSVHAFWKLLHKDSFPVWSLCHLTRINIFPQFFFVFCFNMTIFSLCSSRFQPVKLHEHHANVLQNLKNIFDFLLNLWHEALRQLWRDKEVQPSISNLDLIKWMVDVATSNTMIACSESRLVIWRQASRLVM